jgi:hypothetical protein
MGRAVRNPTPPSGSTELSKSTRLSSSKSYVAASFLTFFERTGKGRAKAQRWRQSGYALGYIQRFAPDCELRLLTSHGVAVAPHSPPYPFTAPAVSPAMICFWAAK